ncbi:MAG: hypothetical protein GSR80_000960 [Desulfurococcales archaeon]|nr:hypothetical protein [Desulfurococcales archaeon]
MSVSVTIKVRKEVVELADKMVRYGIARSRSHAINLMIERGIAWARGEVEFWEGVYEKAKRLEREGYRIRHGGLTGILEEARRR